MSSDITIKLDNVPNVLDGVSNIRIINHDGGVVWIIQDGDAIVFDVESIDQVISTLKNIKESELNNGNSRNYKQ